MCKKRLAPPNDRDRIEPPRTLPNTPGVRTGSADHGTLLARECEAQLSVDMGMATHPDSWGYGQW